MIALLGPTASGKTDIAIQLADRFDVALISVDSAMIYRGMDIGTAKPSAATLREYPHALIDILDPETDYSAGDFVASADDAVEAAFTQRKIPLLVGGTMLYLRAFRDGIARLPRRDARFRANLRLRAEKLGINKLHAELQRIDPVIAARIHPNNYPRIERALEVCEIAGVPMSKLLTERAGMRVEKRLHCHYQEYSLLHVTREELHNRIAARVLSMMDAGFVEEVRRLMARPRLTSNAMSMKSVGYRQLWEHLKSDPSINVEPATIESIAAATRQLARRQLTWLRSWRDLPEHRQLVDVDPLEALTRSILQFV